MKTNLWGNTLSNDLFRRGLASTHAAQMQKKPENGLQISGLLTIIFCTYASGNAAELFYLSYIIYVITFFSSQSKEKKKVSS